MATYNDGRFLRPAMESILHQTYRPFRFLIVDDASTDDTQQILRATDDPRIEVLRLERNVGQTAALNIGLRHASTPWVARMDADDVSHPQRLEEQMGALEEDTSVSCVGTGIWEFREDPRRVEAVKFRPKDHAQIQRAALHGSGMIHGSIVVNRPALLDVGAYDERYRYASDRDMFIRLFVRNRAMNIQKPLLGVRRHPGQDSFSKRATDEYIEIFARLLSRGGYPLEETAILRGSLAYSYLLRAGYFRSSREYANGWKDVLEAFRICPKTCVRGLVGAFTSGLFPERIWASFRNRLFLQGNGSRG